MRTRIRNENAYIFSPYDQIKAYTCGQSKRAIAPSNPREGGGGKKRIAPYERHKPVSAGALNRHSFFLVAVLQ